MPRQVPDFGVVKKLPTIAGLQTPKVSSVDLMWLLGLYIGDGSLHLAKTYRVQFAIPATDVELRAELIGVVKGFSACGASRRTSTASW